MKSSRFALVIAITWPVSILGGCAPPGYVYDAGSFTPRRVDKPVVEISARSPTQAKLSQEQISLVLGSKSPPPISDCRSWEEIDRRAIRAAVANSNVAQNDFAGDTLREAHGRGWPLDAAKQLFVVLLAAHSAGATGEAQFVEQQYKNCMAVAAKPGQKYSNVTLGLYDSAEQRARAKEHFDRVQAEHQQKQQRLQPCLEYKAQASMVQLYKQNGFSLEQTQSELGSRAYGPGGIVYRGSRETETMLVRLARAGYERNPATWIDEQSRSTRDFGTYAYAMCMKGSPF